MAENSPIDQPSVSRISITDDELEIISSPLPPEPNNSDDISNTSSFTYRIDDPSITTKTSNKKKKGQNFDRFESKNNNSKNNISKKSKSSGLKKDNEREINDNDEDIAYWSEAKKQSWASIKTNPNAFFYRHCAPGEKKRTGAWDEAEKKLFFEVMKIHPPSQGKWGLLAQHIPGRVGYQCRNFYHRLLESGEVVALPEEIEKMNHRQRKSGKKTTNATSQGNTAKGSPKKYKKKKAMIEDEELKEELEDEIEEEIEEVEIEEPIVEKPKKVEKINEKNNEESTKQKKKHHKKDKSKKDKSNTTNLIIQDVPVVDSEQEVSLPEPIEHNYEELNTGNQTNCFVSQIPSEFVHHVYVPQAPFGSGNVTNEHQTEMCFSDEEKSEEESQHIKWTPRMAEPWKTITASANTLHEMNENGNDDENCNIIVFPDDVPIKYVDEPEFEFESAKIMHRNVDNPMNLILFSFPTTSQTNNTDFINKARDHLLNDNKQEKQSLTEKCIRSIERYNKGSEHRKSKIERRFVRQVVKNVPK